MGRLVRAGFSASGDLLVLGVDVEVDEWKSQSWTRNLGFKKSFPMFGNFLCLY
jgi:hypothetical protein